MGRDRVVGDAHQPLEARSHRGLRARENRAPFLGETEADGPLVVGTSSRVNKPCATSAPTAALTAGLPSARRSASRDARSSPPATSARKRLVREAQLARALSRIRASRGGGEHRHLGTAHLCGSRGEVHAGKFSWIVRISNLRRSSGLFQQVRDIDLGLCRATPDAQRSRPLWTAPNAHRHYDWRADTNCSH